nr:MAG TPA: hypothetical protein [Caudoviricetes sp.]
MTNFLVVVILILIKISCQYIFYQSNNPAISFILGA